MDKLHRSPILLWAITPFPLHRGLWTRPDPSKKGWLPAGRLCHFWHRDASSQGLTLLADNHNEAGRCCKGLDAPSQHRSTHSGYQVIPAHCLSEWCFVLTSHTSHGCILFSASHNFFYSFFFFLNSSYGFLSPPHWFPCTLHGHSCCWGCCTISLQHDPQTGYFFFSCPFWRLESPFSI